MSQDLRTKKDGCASSVGESEADIGTITLAIAGGGPVLMELAVKEFERR